MPDVRRLIANPKFQGFPLEQRVAALEKVGASDSFIKKYAALEEKPETPSLRPQQERGVVGRLRNWLTGIASERRINRSEREGLRKAGVGLVPTTEEEIGMASLPLLPIAIGAAPVATGLGVAGGMAGEAIAAPVGRAAGERVGPGVGDLGEQAFGLAGAVVGGGSAASLPALARKTPQAFARGVSGTSRAVADVGQAAKSMTKGESARVAMEMAYEGALDTGLSMVPGGSLLSGVARRGIAAVAKSKIKAPSMAAPKVRVPSGTTPKTSGSPSATINRLEKLAEQGEEKRILLAKAREQFGPKGDGVVEEILRKRAAKELVKVLPKGSRAMATNLGGKAKPGPKPTAPENLEATLRASVEKGKTKPFDSSMSSAERAPATPKTPSQLETALPKGEGPGSVPFSLGKRARGPGDIPQIEELAENAAGIAKNPDVPADLATRLMNFSKRALSPSGKLMGRETGTARATLPRRKILTEYINLLKDPKLNEVFGSDELLRHAQKLELKLEALRNIERLTAR